MKRTLMLLLMMLLIIPGTALAHSKLDSAVPAQDSAVAESPALISMTYNTKIEKLSKFTVTNSAGDAIEIGEITVEGDTMSGSPAQALPNDTYNVTWTIIGADGHMVEGKYAFEVNAPAETDVPSAEPTAEPSPEATETASPTVEPSSAPDNNSTDTNSPAAEEDNDINPLFIIIGAIVVVIAVILIVRRRK